MSLGCNFILCNVGKNTDEALRVSDLLPYVYCFAIPKRGVEYGQGQGGRRLQVCSVEVLELRNVRHH